MSPPEGPGVVRGGGQAVLLCHDATAGHWQLGPLPPATGAFALIGWTTPAADGGVPKSVVSMLARALVGCGRVTFASSGAGAVSEPGWHSRDADYAGTFPLRAERGWRASLAAVGGGTELPLFSTVREEAVGRLFDDPAYPWWHQGQFVLLSRSDTAPPDLAAIGGIPANVIEPGWATALSRLSAAGIESMLRPGVDGSVAGLLCASLALREVFEAAVHRAAGDFGATCSVLSEEAFAASLASGT